MLDTGVEIAGSFIPELIGIGANVVDHYTILDGAVNITQLIRHLASQAESLIGGDNVA